MGMMYPHSRGASPVPAHANALPVAPAERLALREIVAAADLLEVDGCRFLLVPVSDATLDALAAFEAEAEDLEPSLGAGEWCNVQVKARLAGVTVADGWGLGGLDDREDDDDREPEDFQ